MIFRKKSGCMSQTLTVRSSLADTIIPSVDLKTALNSATWDATYTKLREVTLTYELPTSMVKNFWSGARYVRVSASGRNLITWSHYTKVGYDPEVQQVARSLAVEMTWELWPYPPSRQFFFTVDVGF